jgi:hypothetical protein
MTRRESLAILTIVSGGPLFAQLRERRLLRVWRDGSGSVSEEALSASCPYLIDVLSAYRKAMEGVEVVRFSDGQRRLFSTPAEPFIWGSLADFDRVPVNSRPDTNPLSKLFKRPHEKAAAEAAQQDLKRRSECEERFTAKVHSTLKDLKKYLEANPAAPARCTYFTDLAARMAEDDVPYNLTLTDGWNDCNEAWAPARGIRGRHVIVLFPRRDGDAGVSENSVFEHRRRALQGLFPSAEIVRPSAMQRRVAAMFDTAS